MRTCLLATLALLIATSADFGQNQPGQNTNQGTGQGNNLGNNPGAGQGNNISPGNANLGNAGVGNGNGTAGFPNRSVDGTYVILAYERSGVPMTGVANRAVTIRNNVMTINTGDGQAAKSFVLRFLPSNQILLIEVDPRNPGTVNPGDPITVPMARAGNAGTAAAQGNAGNSTNSGLGTDVGVYVLSTEFFAINVFAHTAGTVPINGTGDGNGGVVGGGSVGGVPPGTPAPPPVVPGQPRVGGDGTMPTPFGGARRGGQATGSTVQPGTPAPPPVVPGQRPAGDGTTPTRFGDSPGQPGTAAGTVSGRGTTGAGSTGATGQPPTSGNAGTAGTGTGGNGIPGTDSTGTAGAQVGNGSTNVGGVNQGNLNGQGGAGMEQRLAVLVLRRTG